MSLHRDVGVGLGWVGVDCEEWHTMDAHNEVSVDLSRLKSLHNSVGSSHVL